MQRLTRIKNLLRAIANGELSKKQLTLIVKASDTEFISALLEIAANVIAGNVQVTEEIKSKLAKRKSLLRQLVNPKVGKEKRKRLIIKIAALLPLLVSLVEDKIQ